MIFRRKRSKARTGSDGFVDLPAGEVIADRYRIESKLGIGGMAIVYRAQDMELDETVALKFLRSQLAEHDSSIQRFKQEIKLARRIVHSNVCRTFDIGNWGAVRFVSLEFVHGDTLEHWLKKSKRIDLGERIFIFRGILAGLRAAHELDIIHRDLKPQNIMISADENRPLIMDFGIATELSGSSVTATGDTYGTPAYMAPERIQDKPVDQRSDLYSLGVILYELATGELPFLGRTAYETAAKQLNDTAVRPSAVHSLVPEWLDRVVLRLLAKDPEERYQSVVDLMADLPVVDHAGTRSVLLVDGDETLLTLLQIRLESQDLVVRTAADGAKGLESALAHPPDLICVDLKTPVMDGFDFLNLLRQQWSRTRVPIFMWSSVADPQYERQALRLGIERFFNKPFDPTDVANQIAERLSSVF
jgi:serine/threonine protein kinase